MEEEQIDQKNRRGSSQQNSRKVKVWYNNNAIDHFDEVDKKLDRLGDEDRKDPVKV